MSREYGITFSRWGSRFWENRVWKFEKYASLVRKSFAKRSKIKSMIRASVNVAWAASRTAKRTTWIRHYKMQRPALYLRFSSGSTRKLLFSSFNSQIDFQQLRHSFTIVTPAPFNKAVKENGKRQSPRWIYLRLNRTKHVNRAAFQRRFEPNRRFRSSY